MTRNWWRPASLAYSATGQLSQSEDLAQEAFVDAWRQLSALREPEKLRSWLCGILRHKVGRLRRADGKEPVRQAETLEDAGEFASAEAPVADLAVQKGEQAIMWIANRWFSTTASIARWSTWPTRSI